jgi:hypothetical protein
MKIASKAFSIGDKLYNLERIHSKLFHYFKVNKQEGIKDFNIDINKAINCLHNTIVCFSDNKEDKFTIRYLSSIKSLANKNVDNNYCEVWENLKYCHSTFAKYRVKNRKNILKGCETDFQDVCFHLYKIEKNIKDRKK